MGDAAQSGEALGRQILRAMLLQIPTLFGRLDFLASLQNRQSGVYEHAVLSQVVDPADLDKLLRYHHRQVFSEWLASNLEDQKADLSSYLHAPVLGTRASEGLARLAAHAELIPGGAREVERKLYLTDWETLLELLNFGLRDEPSR